MIDKIYQGTKEQRVDDISSLYMEQKRGVISFLYFANAMHWRLFEPQDRSLFPLQQSYRTALSQADMILPDGIALQLFSQWGFARELHNLNGTDTIPFLLDRYTQEGKTVHLTLYGVYDPKISKDEKQNTHAISYVKKRRPSIHVELQQSLYSEKDSGFDRNSYARSLQNIPHDIAICIVCTGTPHQEIRSEKHSSFFEKHNILVFNAGGIIDFRSGFEKRAPAWAVKARVLETPRRILQHPKKNLKKVKWMFGIIRYRFSLMQQRFTNLLKTGK